ncbi:hypothetical protein HDU77_008282 [Chytriomyces hyalinus]|nr:hypothetical protein HDU77_008282 [Chytriomyces hyalinus]
MSSASTSLLDHLRGRNGTLEGIKNILLAYTVYKYGKYALAYIRVKGVQGAIVALFKQLLQISITIARRFVPGANAAIASQIEKNVTSLQKKLMGDVPDHLKQHALPLKGLPASAVVTELKRLKATEHVDWKAGKISGAVYHGGEDVNKLVTEAFGMFTVANPLHPELFPGVRQMEAEVVSMLLRMYNAPDSACGSMTSGGTESLLMAIKTYRDMARELRGVTEPELIAPVTVHTAVDKGAAYFGIKLIHIPVDPATGQVNMAKVANAINGNTVMIVGSAPNYPHGIVDPIPELSALAVKYKIPLHVDACLGGFIVPFAEKAGFPLPFHVDFRVEGVTSISADTHKYGFAPKGSSVIMYRSKEIRNYQYFITTEWPGGVYCSPTIAGSRPGALVAGCWAAMMHFGESGYVETTRQILTAARSIADGIKSIEQLQVIGQPKLSVVAFNSKSPKVKIYAVADILDKRGWHLNVLQNPPAIHIACTYLNVRASKVLLTDLKEAIAMLLKDPSCGNGDVAAIYGTMASVPDRTVISDVCRGFLDALTMIISAEMSHSATHDLLAGLLCGGLANLVPSVLTNPFDVLKIRLQCQPEPAPGADRIYKSFSHASTRILHEEGLRGLILPGMVATCLRELSYSSLRFGLYQPVKGTLHRLFLDSSRGGNETLAKGGEPFFVKLASAMMIGCVGSSLASPTDLVKIRLQREAGRVGSDGLYVSGLNRGLPPSYNNTFQAFYKIVQTESFWGLYKGVQATAIRASLVTGAQLSSYDETKYVLKKYGWMNEGFPLHFVASIVAGLCATTAGAPADIIKTRLLSQQVGPSGLPMYSGFVDCFWSMVRTEGARSLFRGWLPSYMRIAPHFVISLPLYEQLRKGFGLGAM